MKKSLFKLMLALLLLSFSFDLVKADSANGRNFINKPWNEIVAAAKGATVNWYMWGGADNINSYVSDYIGGIMKSKYDITVNRVALTDTVEAVNIVLNEIQAGRTKNGSIDLIWINGENFKTMRQANLAFCGYTATLPNNVLIDWDNPSIANDFGVAVNGCEVPWSRAQFAFAYDKARTPYPPKSIPSLIKWIKKHPGRLTYPAPPDFTGSVFIRHIFVYAAGGANNVLGPFDQKTFDKVSKKTWEILNDLEPYLWRKGKTYPNSVNALKELFANKEVDFYFSYEPSQFGIAVQDGVFPKTVRSFGLKDGTISNTNYTIIPINSPHKAAAMVLSNLLLSGEAQYEKAKPTIWGASPAIEVGLTSRFIQNKFSKLKKHPSVVSTQELAKASLPEMQSDWISAIEKGWLENVGK